MYTVYTIHCTMNTAQCTVYNEFSTVYSVHYTVYRVYYTITTNNKIWPLVYTIPLYYNIVIIYRIYSIISACLFYIVQYTLYISTLAYYYHHYNIAYISISSACIVGLHTQPQNNIGIYAINYGFQLNIGPDSYHNSTGMVVCHASHAST